MNEAIIKKIRQFNRYYTVWLNVMNKGYLGTSFSWPESRVIFEIYSNQGINATELCEHLNMDKGYVSRILAKLEEKGFLSRKLVSGSKGIKKLYLTNAGNQEAKQIDQNGDQQIYEKLKNMDKKDCDRLCEAMVLIENTLRKNEKNNIDFEGTAMNIEIVLAYTHTQEINTLFSEYTNMLIANDSSFQNYLELQHYDEEIIHLEEKYGMPSGRLYLAYCNGEAAGCIGLKKIDDKNCEMKRLYVRPQFRGKKIGKLLVQKIIFDAKEIGYSYMLLDTLPFLGQAIHLYEKFGFYKIDCYNNSPMSTSLYMKLDL